MKHVIFTILKTIGITVFILIILLTTTLFVYGEYNMITKSVEKKVSLNDETRVLTKDEIMTDFEKRTLTNALKTNENVLLVFNQTDNDDININEIIDRYIVDKEDTNNEIPYVIYNYNTSNNVLKTYSGNGAKFDDIEIEISDYTSVYKYIGNVHSSYYTKRYKQERDLFLMGLCGILIFMLLLAIFIKRFIYDAIKWHLEYTYDYRKTFFTGKIKVRIGKKFNEGVGLAIYGQYPPKKNMLLIPLTKKEIHAIKIVEGNSENTLTYHLTYDERMNTFLSYIVNVKFDEENKITNYIK